MIISLLVAASDNNAIGKDNKLLWYLPEDLKFFKNTSWGMPIIMGRKTFESMGKPLPGRTNIVITTKWDWKAEGAVVVTSIADALKAAEVTDAKEVFITGGGEIYKQTMEMADKIIMTRVHVNLVADTFFPDINPHTWKLLSNKVVKADDKNKYDMSFETWIKKHPVTA